MNQNLHVSYRIFKNLFCLHFLKYHSQYRRATWIQKYHFVKKKCKKHNLATLLLGLSFGEGDLLRQYHRP